MHDSFPRLRVENGHYTQAGCSQIFPIHAKGQPGSPLLCQLVHQIQVQCHCRIVIEYNIPCRKLRFVGRSCNRLEGGSSDGRRDIYFVLVGHIPFSLEVTNSFRGVFKSRITIAGRGCRGGWWRSVRVRVRSPASMGDVLAVLANCVIFATGDCLPEFLQFLNLIPVYTEVGLATRS